MNSSRQTIRGAALVLTATVVLASPAQANDCELVAQAQLAVPSFDTTYTPVRP